jgi:non-specific serine/threonine protein kinase
MNDEPMEEPGALDAFAREAWPPRTAVEWASAWGLEDSVGLEQALATHAAIVTLAGAGGVTSLYANGELFSEFVLGAFARWCELLGPVPLQRWAAVILSGLTGIARPVTAPVFHALAAAGLATTSPSSRAQRRSTELTWNAVLSSASPAMRFATRYRLARLLRLTPRVVVVRHGGGARLEYRPDQEYDTGAAGGWDRLVETVSARERDILERRLRGATLEEIGREFGVSRNRPGQIEARGLRRLRHPSRSTRFRWQLLGRLDELPSTLVFRPDAVSRALACALGFDEAPVRMTDFIERLLDVEFVDLDGLLVVVRSVPRGEIIPRADEHGRRPRGAISIREDPARPAHPDCDATIAGGSIGVELALRPGSPPGLAVRGKVTSTSDKQLRSAFRRSTGAGLLHLATAAQYTDATYTVAFWRELAACYLDRVVELAADGVENALRVAPMEEALARFVRLAPLMKGVELLTIEVLQARWRDVGEELARELDTQGGDLQRCLDRLGANRKVTGRIHYWLAEARATDPYPFRFKPTYATPSGRAGRDVHAPLASTLAELAVTGDVPGLRSITRPLAHLRSGAPSLAGCIDIGQIVHEAAWSAEEAYALLTRLGIAEDAGIRSHVPDWWRERPRARARVRFGTRPATSLGLDVLVDFSVELVLDGEALDPFEVERVLATARGLVFLRGRWVEVDGARIAAELARWKSVGVSGLVPVYEAVMLVGKVASSVRHGAPEDAFTWALPETGPWLAGALDALAAPGADRESGAPLESSLPLRDYQRVGLGWLARLYELGLGGCLADDMGLGKTLQVLALIDLMRRRGEERPHLVIAPASLLSHWETQIHHWVPDIKVRVAHGLWSGESPRGERWNIADAAVVLVSLTSVERCQWLETTSWGLIVLDEAQSIKNPTNSTTRAVKRLAGHCRLAVTGTPIENELADYWSLFDFINPGLLGSPEDFTRFLGHHRNAEDPYRALRELTAPYLLRRRKSDPAVCAELPPKIEREVPCRLTPVQAVLYQQAVDELAGRLESVEDATDFAGLILPYLHRLKQICNHPSHWLRDGRYDVHDSGKFTNLAALGLRLAEVCEKVLVFTQYRQIADPLADLLAAAYGRSGLVMSSEVPLDERKRYVERFQSSSEVPFMVLTLRTGGAGLNLTAATHIVHFDRWWNPAVENQATDRAHRIGQTRSVTVHTFICRGTLEERIDRLLREKHALAEDVLATDGEAILTRMTRDELLAVLALDVNAASGSDAE